MFTSGKTRILMILSIHSMHHTSVSLKLEVAQKVTFSSPTEPTKPPTRRHPQHVPDHQVSHVLRIRSQTWSTLHQRPWGSTMSHFPQQTWKDATSHAHPDRQQHGPRRRNQQHLAPTHQSDGHEVLVATRPQQPGAVLLFLVPWAHKSQWLFH